MASRMASQSTAARLNTHAAPAAGVEAIEIPAVGKARLCLDGERSWIVVG